MTTENIPRVSIGVEFLDARERFEDGLPIAMIATDMQGKVTHWSAGASQLYGWTRDEAIGADIQSLTVGPDSAEVAADIIAQVLSGAHWEGEFRAWHKSGRPVDIHVLDAPILDRDGTMVGICGLSVDVSAQRTEWREAVERSEQLIELLESTRDAERSRIARDIHDDIGQYLTSLRTELLGLGETDASCISLVDTIGGMVAKVDNVLNEVRRICAELRPPVLEQFGVGQAIESLAEEVSRRNHYHADIDARSFRGRLQPDTELTIFRIAEEALTNIERHAGASSVRVTLSCLPQSEGRVRLVLEIADDGTGLRGAAPQGDEHSLGLSGMRARARRLHGRLTFAPGNDGLGTTVRLEIDVEPRLVRHV
jgi:PAS domain S-box-containing protein